MLSKIDKQIFIILYENNVKYIKKRNGDDNVVIYLQNIFKNSHIFIKLAFEILKLILRAIYIFISLLFFSKNLKIICINFSINILSKLPIFKEVIKLSKIYSIIYNYDQ